MDVMDVGDKYFFKFSFESCSFWLHDSENLLDMLGQDEIDFFRFFLSINRTEPKMLGLNRFRFDFGFNLKINK